MFDRREVEMTKALVQRSEAQKSTIWSWGSEDTLQLFITIFSYLSEVHYSIVEI